ncbi:MAG: hypothetical protein JST00_22150 [Deltaproteobacteria bacterium]|nr:hypothetical protein [Deltaproteobacteria bacterium]
MANDGKPRPPPPGMANIFANALASKSDFGGRSVGAGMHNTLECKNCGAARERAVEGPLVCRYCGEKLV